MTAAGHWRDETLLDHLTRLVARTPDKTAIVAVRSETGEERRLTYRELDHLSSLAALGLAERGVGRGDVVSFQLPNGWEFSVLHLACLKPGAVSNPLMHIFRERELGFMLGLAESKVMVVPARFRGVDYPAIVANVRGSLPALRHVLVTGGQGPDAFDTLPTPEAGEAERATLQKRPLGPDDVIQLLYTSGTTGEPKGVMHTSNTMLANLVPLAERLHLGAEDVIHMPSPMAHQLGFMYGLVLPVLLGATAVLQGIFAAGTPIPRALVSKARRVLGAAIISAWGMSENGAVTTTRPEDPEEKTTGTDGCPLPGMEVRVVDAEGLPAAVGDEGELHVRGCPNFVGYWRRPELCLPDADGYIRIAGRSKGIIIRGGENIPVVEVEGLLFKHPAIAAVDGERQAAEVQAARAGAPARALMSRHECLKGWRACPSGAPGAGRAGPCPPA